MTGLRTILLAKSALAKGGPDDPAVIQMPDEHLLAQFERFAQGGAIKGYALGGDVEGGREEGVGGMGNGGGFDPGGYSGDNIDYGGISEGMGNWGEANGYGRDFSGDGGRNDGFMGYGDREFGGYERSGGTSFQGFDISDVTMGDSLYGELSDALSGGGEGGAPAPDPMTAFGFNDFGALTEDGRLTGEKAKTSDIGSIGTAPLDGTMDDYAPGPMQTMGTGLSPDSFGGLALAAAPVEDLDFSTDEPAVIDEDAPVTSQHPATMDVNFGLNPKPGAMNLARPDVVEMTRMALTENRKALAQGHLDAVQMPMEVALNRAAIGYGPRGWETRRGLDRTDVVDQINAPAQFSGMHNKRDLANAAAFAETHPDLTAQTMGVAKGLLTGEIDPVTEGALSFRGYGAHDQVRGPRENFSGNIAFDYNDRARNAYAERQDAFRGLNGPYADDNPAFDAPAGGPTPGPQSGLQDIDTAVPNFDDVEVARAPAPTATAGMTFGDILGGMLGIGPAYAGEVAPKTQDRVPDLPNQQAYQDAPATYDANAPARAAMGDVNARRVDAPAPATGPSSWDIAKDLGSMALTGLGNFFTFDADPLAAEEAPARAFSPSGHKAAAATMDEAFPGVDMGYANPTRSMGSFPGFGQPQRGPAMGGTSGFKSDTGIPSGLPGDRMRLDPSIDATPRRHEIDAPRAGALVAGGGVPSDESFAPRGTTPSRTTGPMRGLTTDTVFGPTMPGMLPGTETYPERGVIAQPSTWAHEKIAEKLGPAALGAMVPGLGPLSTLSGLVGGPSLSGLFGNSTPGLDIGLGLAEPGDHTWENAPRGTANTTDKPKDGPKKPDAPKPAPVTSAVWARRYLGPPKNPETYGYGPQRRFYSYG